jgi:hypothetical protein
LRHCATLAEKAISSNTVNTISQTVNIWIGYQQVDIVADLIAFGVYEFVN